MIPQIKIPELKKELEFVEKAKQCFEKNNNIVTFGDLTEDSLFAVRWGMDNDCIMVFTIKDEPRNYVNIIGKSYGISSK